MASRRDSMPEPLMGWALLCFALLCAFPLGGHRPALWMLQTSASFLACGVLLIAAAARGSRFPAGPGNGGREDLQGLLGLSLTWALCLVVFQMLPATGLAPWFPAHDPESSLIGALRLLGTLSFGLACLQAFRRRHRAGLAALALLFGMVLHAAYGFVGLRLESWVLPGELAYPGFLTGAFVNRNSFATYLGIAIVLCMALLCSPLPWRKTRSEGADTMMWRACFSVLACFLIAGLLATGSRMGLVATIIGLGALGLGLAYGGKGRRKYGLLLLLPALPLPLILVMGNDPLLDRMLDLGENTEARIALYRATLRMISDSPWLGVGLDNFSEMFREYQDLSVSPDLRWNDAHSTYLENWSELGLIVGSLPILIGGLTFIHLLRRIRLSGGRDALSLAAMAGLIVGAVHTAVDFSLEIQGVLLPLILLIVLALSPAPQTTENEVTA